MSYALLSLDSLGMRSWLGGLFSPGRWSVLQLCKAQKGSHRKSHPQVFFFRKLPLVPPVARGTIKKNSFQDTLLTILPKDLKPFGSFPVKIPFLLDNLVKKSGIEQSSKANQVIFFENLVAMYIEKTVIVMVLSADFPSFSVKAPLQLLYLKPQWMWLRRVQPQQPASPQCHVLCCSLMWPCL